MSKLRVLSAVEVAVDPGGPCEFRLADAMLLRVNGGVAGLGLVLEAKRVELAPVIRVEILLERGSAHGDFESLPVRILSGAVITAAGLASTLRCPSETRGFVELELVAGGGRRAHFVGHHLRVVPET